MGKRFIKFWSHPNFIYRLTDLYKIERRESEIIDKLTGHVSADFSHLSFDKKMLNTPFQIRQVKKQEYFEKNRDEIGAKVITEDSNESYKSPQVLIDQMFRLFYAGKFTEDIVKEQIETVIIAGNETSALTISYVILLLAMYPEVQERLYEELNAAYHPDEDYSTYEQVQKLTYLDWVLKEGLRLFPAAPFIVRCCTADTKISTCTIPKDAIVMMSIFTLHRREEIWGEDAKEFNPDRFDPERSAGRDPFSFLPYSGGPRNCIGKNQTIAKIAEI